MVVNLYYTALPVGMCAFPPFEIPSRQFLPLSPFFPHVGDRWRRVKRSTTLSRLGLARLELWLLSNLQSFPKGDQQLWRYQNSSQPNRMKSIFLAESCWLPIDCEPAACCSVFWTKIGHETCIMSNLVEIYWRHVRDFFQLCWFILWKLLKHWPNISGFHPFFFTVKTVKVKFDSSRSNVVSRVSSRMFSLQVPTWRLGREALCGGGEDVPRMPERSSKRPCRQVRIPLVVAKHRLHHLSLVTYFADKCLFIFFCYIQVCQNKQRAEQSAASMALKAMEELGMGMEELAELLAAWFKVSPMTHSNFWFFKKWKSSFSEIELFKVPKKP